MRLAVAATCVALAGGCNAVFGLAGLSYEPTGAGPASSASTGAGGSACQQHPPIPEGWTGPMVLFVGGSAPPACGAAWTQFADGGTAPSFAPDGCVCYCGKPVGYMCLTATKTTYFEKTGCDVNTNFFDAAPDGTCTTTTIVGIHSVLAKPTVPAGGMCSASQGALAPAGWKAFARVCAAPSGACPLPAAPSGFPQAKCVSKSGATPAECPAEFPVANVIYRGISDTRACADCTCDAPTGVNCQTQIGIFTDMACGSPAGTVPADGNCHDIGGADVVSQRIFIDPIAGSGSCQAHGGTVASGAVTATEPLTVCCTK